jgi:hypothetical protein
MEITVKETQHLAAGPIFEDSHFDCGPSSGSRLDPVDATLNQTLVFVVDAVPKTASTPIFAAQISPNDPSKALTLCDFAGSESSPFKIAKDILDQSVHPLSPDHIDTTQSTLVSGTTPNILNYFSFGREDSNEICCEISSDCSPSQSTPGPFTDTAPPTAEDCSTLTGLFITETTQTVNLDLAKPPSTKTLTNSDLDTPKAHGSGTFDTCDDGSVVKMPTNSSSASSLCSEETSFTSSTMASEAPAKGDPIASADVGQTDILVKVPDMMSSIMSAKPVVNPHYFNAKPKIDSWTKR